MRNTVRFRADAFNSTDPKPYFINPCCFGDDIATWLKTRLRTLGYDVEGPDQEDWGWYLVCHTPSGRYYLNISHTGDDWQILVERQRTFGQWITRAPKAPDPELTRDLHQILTGASGVTAIEWLHVDVHGREVDISAAP